jgi:hypothetical protein
MARCLILLSALALAACSTTPPPKPEPTVVQVPAQEPPALGVYPLCDNGYLVGIHIATTGGGVWRLSIGKEVCDDRI